MGRQRVGRKCTCLRRCASFCTLLLFCVVMAAPLPALPAASRSSRRIRGTVRPTARGKDRRQAIIEAAAEIIREEGPAAVSHRGVAKRAGCSLSATTYYFKGLDDLLYQAGLVNIAMWASRAESVADRVEALDQLPSLSGRLDLVLQATLPPEGPYLGHYVQLISACAVAPVGQAYRRGRQRLNAAVGRLLDRLEAAIDPDLVIAVVDGAAVTALSEGRDVHATAADLLSKIAAFGTQPDQEHERGR